MIGPYLTPIDEVVLLTIVINKGLGWLVRAVKVLVAPFKLSKMCSILMYIVGVVWKWQIKCL